MLVYTSVLGFQTCLQPAKALHPAVSFICINDTSMLVQSAWQLAVSRCNRRTLLHVSGLQIFPMYIWARSIYGLWVHIHQLLWFYFLMLCPCMQASSASTHATVLSAAAEASWGSIPAASTYFTTPSISTTQPMHVHTASSLATSAQAHAAAAAGEQNAKADGRSAVPLLGLSLGGLIIQITICSCILYLLPASLLSARSLSAVFVFCLWRPLHCPADSAP